MTLPILAHGALGPWDELIFLGVAVIFIGMMTVSWLRSRFTEFTDDDLGEAAPMQPQSEPTAPPPKRPGERFELE